MPTGKTCGSCDHFIRYKEWGGKRNGLCDKLDYNCHSDSSYAKRCAHYQGKRYNRRMRISEKTRWNTLNWYGPIAIIVMVLTFIFMCSDDAQAGGTGSKCVPQSEAIKAWETLLYMAEPDNSGTTTLECNCACWHSHNSAGYYECLAEEARKQAEFFLKHHTLITRAKEHGICNPPRKGYGNGNK